MLDHDADFGKDAQGVQAAKDPRLVMVIHGQDLAARNAVFDWLRRIGLNPREWNQLVQAEGGAAPFIGDVLKAAFRDAQAVVALFTPDEQSAVRGALTGRGLGWKLQARPNVLFEAGMAFATHERQTVVAVLGDVELPSDLAGRHHVRLRDAASLQDLARRLETAGCPVDTSGADWLDISLFPDRSAIVAEPELPTAGGSDAADLKRDLLAAHEGLTRLTRGPQYYHRQIDIARKEFDDAHAALTFSSAVSDASKAAAENLRAAWAAKPQSPLPASTPEARDAARKAFVDSR